VSDGFIVDIVNFFIKILHKLSIIEILKMVSIKCFSKETDYSKKKVANIVIDVFIIFKWLFVSLMLVKGASYKIIRWIIVYLLVMNIHTYFYYHVWSVRAMQSKGRSIKNIRRRFISLILSIGFVMLCFAYFYGVGFSTYFTIAETYSKTVVSIYHSFSSMFGGTTSSITPNSTIGLFIQSVQVLITFVYLGIILSRTDTLEEEI
jgi:hypothetical protein